VFCKLAIAKRVVIHVQAKYNSIIVKIIISPFSLSLPSRCVKARQPSTPSLRGIRSMTKQSKKPVKTKSIKKERIDNEHKIYPFYNYDYFVVVDCFVALLLAMTERMDMEFYPSKKRILKNFVSCNGGKVIIFLQQAKRTYYYSSLRATRGTAIHTLQ
jgi:hypothetical protein